MRIRKHAKISPLNYASSVFLRQHGAVLQPHLCQLNQSPWDVITFPIEDNYDNYQLFSSPPPPPPPPLLVAPSSSSYKLDGYGSCAVNGTFCDSEQSITSMKKLDDNREMNFSENNNVTDDVPAGFKKAEEDDGVNNNKSIMCCKNDGKGWQCCRVAKRGHNLCKHHFAQLKRHYGNNIDSPQYSTITNVVATSSVVVDAAAEMASSSRGRPHRPKKSSSSDFYYYSGFGPLWPKKRDASTGKKNNAAASTAIAAAENNSSHNNTQMDNEGFKDVEDEDDHDEVENDKLMQKTRKRIKARSLKSLM